METDFNAAVSERIDAGEITQNYTNMVLKIKYTNTKLLKHFLNHMRVPGYASTYPTKERLFSSLMFHLLHRFLVRRPTMPTTSTSQQAIDILDAEKSYWLYVSGGMNMESAEILFDQRIEEIIKCENQNQKEQNPEFECPICMDKHASNMKIKLGCSHTFCGICIENTIRVSQEKNSDPCCALCRETYTKIYTYTYTNSTPTN
jgi:hypothetical protein